MLHTCKYFIYRSLSTLCAGVFRSYPLGRISFSRAEVCAEVARDLRIDRKVERKKCPPSATCTMATNNIAGDGVQFDVMYGQESKSKVLTRVLQFPFPVPPATIIVKNYNKRTRRLLC